MLTYVQGDAESETEEAIRPDFESRSRSRRESMPHRSSVSLSLPPTIDMDMLPNMEFQQRRKRAAKLAQFFGVGYRDLFGEVLETIETGVEDDGYRGTLTADQVQVSYVETIY